jgi:hypothetical protein
MTAMKKIYTILLSASNLLYNVTAYCTTPDLKLPAPLYNLEILTLIGTSTLGLKSKE